MCAARYWATWCQHAKELPSIARACGRALAREVDKPEAEVSEQILKDFGVDAKAMAFTEEAEKEYERG
eukprot:4942951-Lingulodinium_polyedra.AAC.1